MFCLSGFSCLGIAACWVQIDKKKLLDTGYTVQEQLRVGCDVGRFD